MQKNRDQRLSPIPVFLCRSSLVGGDGFEPPALSV
jgi:hypothetical protein